LSDQVCLLEFHAVVPRLPALGIKGMAAVGRTAFSNYILQTLICTTIFYGHGFGYFGSVPRTRPTPHRCSAHTASGVAEPLEDPVFSGGSC
jgi:hypothetical protein